LAALHDQISLFKAEPSLNDAGLLARLPQLVADGVTQIDLRGCRIHTKGIAALVSQLLEPSSSCVVDLCLANMWVSSEGVELLATALRGNTRLERLDLSNTGAQVDFTRGSSQRGLHALSAALLVHTYSRHLDLVLTHLF
jgi:hypothetical protein